MSLIKTEFIVISGDENLKTYYIIIGSNERFGNLILNYKDKITVNNIIDFKEKAFIKYMEDNSIKIDHLNTHLISWQVLENE